MFRVAIDMILASDKFHVGYLASQAPPMLCTVGIAADPQRVSSGYFLKHDRGILKCWTAWSLFHIFVAFPFDYYL
jgi:hypothetical protein